MSGIKKLKTRDEIPQQDKWNISLMYETLEDWEKDFSLLKEKALLLPGFSGQLADAEKLLAFFRLDEELSLITEKLYIYAKMRCDEDTANTTFIALKNKMGSFLAELDALGSFFVPEILSYPEGTIEKTIEKLPELQLYSFRLQKILKLKPHTLDAKSEKLLASVSDCLSTSGNVFELLSYADMTFPTIKNEEGQEVEFSENDYSVYLISKNREVRQQAFKALYTTYGKFKNTYAALLISSVKNDVFDAKTRNYASTLESALKPNDIPTEVYKKAIETINANLPALHRYVNIKKRLLGLDEIHMYDLYAPVIDVPVEHIEFNDAVETIKSGLKPLGEEYLGDFEAGIKNGWVDRYPNKGKASGAYSISGYKTLPYILINYNNRLKDVLTLAHEMGHSLHSFYSNRTQPYIYHSYTLFCAEVASTTNEALLIHHLIKTEKDKNKRLYLINSQLEQIRTTVYRQLMFAEFELFTHESTEAGTPLTANELCSFWHELNVKYFGSEIIVDSEIDMEWARIPHFYRDYYVYQYATGYAAANSFARMILNGEENAVEKYKGFLKSGGSDYPIAILAKAGVDMLSSKPLEDTITLFNDLLDMLEGEKEGSL